MEDDNEGKCVGCGYLSWRVLNDVESPFFEVNEDSRKSSIRPTVGAVGGASNRPFCYRRALPSITEQYVQLTSNNLPHKEAFLQVVNENRKCISYCVYVPNRSPDTHTKMIEAIKLAELNSADKRDALDRAERQFERQLAHQAAESDKARDWQQDRDADQHNKQIERDAKLADATDKAQKERDRELATINYENQIKRDAALSKDQVERDEAQRVWQEEQNDKRIGWETRQAKWTIGRWVASGILSVVFGILSAIAVLGTFIFAWAIKER